MRSKIIFIIPHLLGGGAEKSLLTLINNLDRSKFQPLLVYFTETAAPGAFLAKDVKAVCLHKVNRYSAPRLILSLAALIKREKPSLLVPFMPYAGFLTSMARRLAGTRTPLIISHRSNLSAELQHETFPFLKAYLARQLYPQATSIHCLSQGIGYDLMNNFKISPEKIKVIYNLFDLKEITAKAKQKVEHSWFKQDVPILLACGRLTRQKNYPQMLRAVRRVMDQSPVRLMILGEGEDRRYLEEYTAHLALPSSVAFLGFQANPFAFMARATALVLSSSYEGFGRVIVEAMACGLPVISTRCPYGPEEIITPGVNGLLVPVDDDAALADAILSVLKDEAWRQRLAQGGLARARDFAVENLMPQYEKLFEEVIAGSI
uniref:Glycosyltransferase n=1 Tax=Desulfobacca acetoxidans TaxID=60893 RepID=A0A7C3SK42_9BACT